MLFGALDNKETLTLERVWSAESLVWREFGLVWRVELVSILGKRERLERERFLER